MLETRQLSIGYGRYCVQSKLNLSVGKSELICLVGTNGAGKSTLLRTLSGLQPALAGSVIVAGKNVSKLSQNEASLLFSLVLTDRIEVENMTVVDMVALGRYPYTSWTGRLRDSDYQIVKQALEQVNLTHLQHKMIDAISDGEKQRSMIAKALTQDTPLVFLDEPTAHLDLPNRIEIMMLLRRLSVTTQKSFILSTHELELAMQMADKIWLMTPDGVKVGIPEDLMLNGDFQQAFGSERFRFDANDGHYTVNHPQGELTVAIEGTEPATSWVRHAMERCGIRTAAKADIIIKADDKGMFVNESAVANIEALLDELTKISRK